MHSHDHDVDGEVSLRPKASRLDDAPVGHAAGAAAAGRTDVLDAAAVLRLQRDAGNRATGSLLDERLDERPDDERSPVHDVLGSGGGVPLAPDVRADMEDRLGHDFGDVRVHTDARAQQSAQAVGAHAYTVGSDVVFQRDRFDPASTEGRTTLAHELTHVVQQRQGAVDGTRAPGGIRVSDPSDRFEREAAATADRVMALPSVADAPMTAPATQVSGVAAVQRQEAPEEERPEEERPDEEPPEEEPVQGAFVQREAAPDEEQEPEES